MPSKFRKTITIGHDSTGKAIRKSFYGKTKKEVNAKVDAYKLEVATSINPEAGTMIFAEWAEHWITNYKEDYVGESALYTCELCIRHLNEYFGTSPLGAIKPVDIQKFFKQKKQFSESMVNKLKITANGIFETACANDQLIRNPMRGLTLPNGVKTQEKRSYSPEDARRVMEFAKTNKYGLGPYIILKTGIRRGELVGLIPTEDIDLEKRRLHVRRSIRDVNGYTSINQHGKSDNAIRTIPLDAETAAYLNNHLAIRQPGYLFKNKKGSYASPNSYARNTFKKFRQQLQQRYPDIELLTLHELRHTYGTLMYKSGTDVRTLQKLMGHASINTTMGIYVHDNIEDIEKNIKMDALQVSVAN